jgi:hypothetical protein
MDLNDLQLFICGGWTVTSTANGRLSVCSTTSLLAVRFRRCVITAANGRLRIYDFSICAFPHAAM